MTQITTGIRSLLSGSAAYDAVQNLLGARRSRQRLVDEYIRPSPGDCILDVGCGTCAILDSLPDDVAYVGMDLSPRYIEAAQRKYAGRGRFHCMDIAKIATANVATANVAIAVGLLHHLGDDEVVSMLSDIARCLAPGGRLVTIDPCFHPDQSMVARYLISKDRGQNVRTAQQYADLARRPFRLVDVTVRHDMARVPYTHSILECAK